MEEIQKQQQTQVAPPAQRKAETPLARFNRSITAVETQQYLLQVLGRKKDQFVNNITALVANDVNLQCCAPMSLIYAGIKATALDFPLDNNLGFAYVIPYNNKKKITDENGVTREMVVKEAQLQWGYRAFIQLAIRSGQFRRINVTDVRDGEIKSRSLLTGEMTFDEAPNRLELPVIGYAAYFELTNGFSKTLYMTTEELQRHATTYSKTYGSKYENTTDRIYKLMHETISKMVIGIPDERTDVYAFVAITTVSYLLKKYVKDPEKLQEEVKFFFEKLFASI